MKVFVTGGCGFIGYHVLHRLITARHHVTVFDNCSTGKLSNVADLLLELRDYGPLVSVIKGDVRDYAHLIEASRGHDSIIHLAAIASVAESVKNPLESFKTNALGTLNVLDAAKANGIKTVVYASSAAVYGDRLDTTRAVTELEPLSPYGADKLTSDIYARLYRELYGVRTIGLRFFNVYGPRQDPNSEYAGVIAKFIAKAKADEPVMIYGDGEQTRCFVYVGDVAMVTVGFAAGWKSNGTQDVNGVFNVANADASVPHVSLNHLVDALEVAIGKPIERIYLPSRAGEIQESRASLLRLIQEDPLLPKFTSLEAGLKLTLEA